LTLKLPLQRLLIGTTNAGKLREMRHLLGGVAVELLGPVDLGLESLEVPEEGSTFAENAAGKAKAWALAARMPAIADDSGLEVDALGGAPGIMSARWVSGSDADRCAALLRRLRHVAEPSKRAARFRAAVALAGPDGRVILAAEGTVQGRIAQAPRGTGGFGYDPIFEVLDGDLKGRLTMAELPPEAKARLSHRARAVSALVSELARQQSAYR